MEKQRDLRVEKTYLALTNTFTQMLAEMPFEKIRVAELCERAMVRRATFYLHFEDKYAFLYFYLHQFQTRFEQEAERLSDIEDTVEYLLAFNREMLSFFSAHIPMLQRSMESQAMPMMIDMLTGLLTAGVKKRLKQDEERGMVLPAPAEVLAAFYTGGLVQTVRDWISDPERKSEEALLRDLGVLLRQFYW